MQYEANRASREEVEEMLKFLKSAEGDEELKKMIVDAKHSCERELSIPQQRWDNMWRIIRPLTVGSEKKHFFSMQRVRVVAIAASFLVGVSIYLFSVKTHKNKALQVLASSVANHYKADIPPGSDKAMLKLANGSAINLDKLQVGVVIQEGNTKIQKLKSGALAYNSQDRNIGAVFYNTLTTPPGGQYEVILPDGSKVWLNASSSLYYPIAFKGKERTVELKGEAYFEVAHAISPSTGKKMPFLVKANDLNVEVLGTHFNIMAYANEKQIKTTLLLGKVRVTRYGLTKILLPGQEATADDKSHGITLTSANTQQTVAWKNGFFHFKETNIRELMRQVERWYNVEVEYRTGRVGQDFTGIVPRTKNVSALLQTLELTGTVHFQIIDQRTTGHAGKIIVLP
jgi:transmembrane sensor